MARKKRPQPLHKSLRLIEEERANVVKRTQVRLAQLFAEEEANVVLHEEDNVVRRASARLQLALLSEHCMFLYVIGSYELTIFAVAVLQST